MYRTLAQGGHENVNRGRILMMRFRKTKFLVFFIIIIININGKNFSLLSFLIRRYRRRHPADIYSVRTFPNLCPEEREIWPGYNVISSPPFSRRLLNFIASFYR